MVARLANGVNTSGIHCARAAGDRFGSPHDDERRPPDLVAHNAGEGCVYGDFAGTLTLRISDVTMTEAAEWVREAQQRFSTHPGLRGWQPLHRSFPYELDANRAISGLVCNNLPKKKDGQQCDEYPFAATREGAASARRGRIET